MQRYLSKMEDPQTDEDNVMHDEDNEIDYPDDNSDAGDEENDADEENDNMEDEDDEKETDNSTTEVIVIPGKPRNVRRPNNKMKNLKKKVQKTRKVFQKKMEKSKIGSTKK